MNTKGQSHEGMIPAERRQQILNLLQKHEIVTISELTAALKVSHMTIRRDLQKMEEEQRKENEEYLALLSDKFNPKRPPPRGKCWTGLPPKKCSW